MNFERDATNISSNTSLPRASARVFTEWWAKSLALLQETDRALLFGVLKTGKALLDSGALVRPLTLTLPVA